MGNLRNAERKPACSKTHKYTEKKIMSPTYYRFTTLNPKKCENWHTLKSGKKLNIGTMSQVRNSKSWNGFLYKSIKMGKTTFRLYISGDHINIHELYMWPRDISYSIFSKLRYSKVHKIKRNPKYDTLLVPCMVKGDALYMRQDKFCIFLIQRADGYSALTWGRGRWKSWTCRDGGWETVRTFQRRQFIKI